LDNYIKNYKAKGAIRELSKRIEDIIDREPFITETTTMGEYPEKRSFVKAPQGKEIIKLAQAIIGIVEEFYKE